MKNKILSVMLILIILVVGINSACLGAPIVFKVTAGEYQDHPMSKAMEWAQHVIERRSNGEIKMEYYYLGQAGTEKEMCDAVIAGDFDYVIMGPRELGRYIPEIGILNGPYIFRDYDHIFKLLESDLGKSFLAKMEPFGIRFVAPYKYGVRHITTTNKIVRTPSDLHNMKMRVMDEPVNMATMRAMGGQVVPITWAELYMALKQGVADGQENPISNIISGNIQEVQKYLMLTGHVWNIGIGVLNENSFQRFNDEQQEIILRTLHESAAVNDILLEQAEEEGFEIWKNIGNEIIDVDIEPFRAKVVENIYYDLMEDEWKDLYEKIVEIE